MSVDTVQNLPTGAAETAAGETVAKKDESLSVVIPFFNEQGNVVPLLQEVHTALQVLDIPWEIICVNDGSTDNTAIELEEARSLLGEHVSLIHFTRNFGQTAAMQTGIDAARGSVIATLDGDRQNDPADIPRMLEYLQREQLDMVAGRRLNRQDAEISRKLPSRIANWLIRKVTGVNIRDNGCSLKLYRAAIIKQVVLMGEMHRFISAWVASVTDPRRIGEMDVNHRARTMGQSKYGLSRTLRVILDLLAMNFFMRFSRRPGHFFGAIGLTLGVVGSLILGYLLMLKIFLSEDIGSRPLLFTGILLIIASVQLITTGVLAEMLTRATSSPTYPIRSCTAEQGRKWYSCAAE